MFHPFNAHVATTHTTKARITREAEDTVLLESYLTIAHVYIQRAASRGDNGAWVYCPCNLRDRFAEVLRGSGFIVEPAENNVTHFIIKWEEE